MAKRVVSVAPPGLSNTRIWSGDINFGFFSKNPEEPYDPGGEIEIWLEEEKHIITRTSMIFVPAGMEHCPLILRCVDRPIFHFTTVPGGQYIKDETKDAKGE